MPDRAEQSASRRSSGARIDSDPSAAAGGRARLDRLGRRIGDVHWRVPIVATFPLIGDRAWRGRRSRLRSGHASDTDWTPRSAIPSAIGSGSPGAGHATAVARTAPVRYG
jgi:hypothetical protein